MNYIFDSSGVFTAMSLDMPQKLIGGYTLDLARYEIGNMLWKERHLHKRIDATGEAKLLDSSVKVLGGMRILKIDGCERLVLELANRFGCSFYDAAYVYFARVLGFVLVTEDVKLAKKVGAYIKFAGVGSI